MIALAVAAPATAAAPATPPGVSDPVAYCRAVGVADRPGRRYRGPKDLPWMRTPFLQPGAPADARSMPVAWRCMDHRVMVCAYGANLPCDAKADVSRRPTGGAVRFCRENPGSDFIPMAATGHATVYDWRCEGDRAVAGRQLGRVDARGYQRGIWKPAAP